MIKEVKMKLNCYKDGSFALVFVNKEGKEVVASINNESVLINAEEMSLQEFLKMVRNSVR